MDVSLNRGLATGDRRAGTRAAATTRTEALAELIYEIEPDDAGVLDDCLYACCTASGICVGPVRGTSADSAKRVLADLTTACTCGATNPERLCEWNKPSAPAAAVAATAIAGSASPARATLTLVPNKTTAPTASGYAALASVSFGEEENDRGRMQECVYAACQRSGYRVGPIWGTS